MPGSTAPRIPFFGAGRENTELAAPLAALFARVTQSDRLLNGPEVASFEIRAAAAAGRAHAVAVNSATDALYFALAGLGIGPGDEVLVPAYSFVASAACILRAGARPVFVDVLDAGTEGAPATMDLEDAARRIGPRCRAMIWVGLFGGTGDPAPLEAFAETHGLALIEDASQSFGAAWGTRPAGSAGRAAVFSFDRNKLAGAPGTGGALVTDDPALAGSARMLRYHGVRDGHYVTAGQNSQMSSLTAAILELKLAHQARWRTRRAEIAARYDEVLDGLPVTRLRWPDPVHHVHHKYVLLTDAPERLAPALGAAGISTRRHYATPLPAEPVFAAYRDGAGWPVANAMAARALSLPIHAQLTQDELTRVTAALSDCITRL